MSVLGRLLGTRGVAIYLAVLIGAPFFVVRFVGSAIDRAQAPIIKLEPWLLREGIFHDPDKWPTLRESDRLVALNGIPVGRGNFMQVLYRNLEPGPLEVTVERDGLPFVAKGVAEPPTTFLQVAIASRVVQVIIVLLVGLIGFALKPRGRVSWHLLGFCTSLAVLLGAGLAFDQWVVARVCGVRIAGAFFASIGVHLFLEFPERLPWLQRNPVRARWLYVLPAAIAPAFYYSYSHQMLAVASPLMQVIEAWISISILLIFVCAFRQLRLARATGNAPNVARARILLIGVAIGGLVPAIWNLLQFVFYVGMVPGVEFFKVLPVTFFVAVLAYSMFRHNAFEIDRFTRALVGYGVTVFILTAIAGLLFIGLPLVLENVGVVRSPSMLVAITAAAGMGLQPLYRRIKRRVDRWFFRDTGTETTRAGLLSALSRTIQRGNRENAVREAIAAVMSINPDRAELWLLDDSGERFRLSSAQGDASVIRAIPRQSKVGLALAQGTSPEHDTERNIVFDEALWEMGLAMALPIGAHGAISGFLAVGRKKAGTEYTNEELAFLEAVAAQISLALETVRRENLGRYRLERRLGVGGMAEVFLAWQLGPGGFERKVAIKRPLPHYAEDPEAVKMFLDEARISAQLHHRNIMQVYEVDEAQGHYFMAMEFIDGPSLRTLLKRSALTGAPIPLPITISVIDSILSALAYAHDTVDAKGQRMNLVHRDVTPGNILVGRDGVPKLVDFGIARAAEKLHVTRTGIAKGTLVYMSPEQAAGEDVDNRADLYSLGVVLFGMLTGIRAFPNGRLSVGLPPKPPELSDALYEVCACAMQYDRNRRYRNAADMRRALSAARGHVAPASDGDIAYWLGFLGFEADSQRAPSEGPPQTVQERRANRPSAPPPDAPVTTTITVPGHAAQEDVDDDTDVTIPEAKRHGD